MWRNWNKNVVVISAGFKEVEKEGARLENQLVGNMQKISD
jgi:acyl-CoA synthetase (NDP forming)